MRCKKARKKISLALDSRLSPACSDELRSHLRDCAACRRWQSEQSAVLQWMQDAPVLDRQPSPAFQARLQQRINTPGRPGYRAAFSPVLSRPLLRAAMLMLLIFSAVAGFLLSGRLDARAGQSGAAEFSRAMNLDAFADLPAGSFGAVYEGLLQEGLK
jgi:anti-sigma factor RsiW